MLSELGTAARYRLTLQYNGTHFFGFQRCSMGRRTIQGELEKALKQFVGYDVKVTTSGRTDSGVHAASIVTHCDILRSGESPHSSSIIKLRLSSRTIQNSGSSSFCSHYLPSVVFKAVNAKLRSNGAKDLVVIGAEKVKNTFHARYNCKSRLYRYSLLLGYGRYCLPLAADSYWWVNCFNRNFDELKVHRACRLMEGFHEYKAFCRSHPDQEKSGTFRTVDRIELVGHDSKELELVAGGNPNSSSIISYSIYIQSRSFMWRQCRFMVGCLVDVGLGRLTLEELEQMLVSGDKPFTLKCAPSSGLYFIKSYYDEASLEGASGLYGNKLDIITN